MYSGVTVTAMSELRRGGKNSGPWHQWSQKFFQVSRKNEKERGKGINLEKQKNGKLIFCQDRKGCLN